MHTESDDVLENGVTRFFDILFSLIAMLILLPFMLPIMIGLKLTGERYIFYLQPRVGKLGESFNVLKFATMLKDSPNMQGGFITQAKDPRILPMGGFLRKTKINELPQLINILVGQMSFVGPRPIVQAHLDLYPEATRKELLKLRPGLTGIGSLVFRDEEGVLDRSPSDRKRMHDRVIAPYKGELELWYTKNRSMWVYFALIGLTAWAVFRPGSDIYKRIFKDLPKTPPELAAIL
jgi:lipopolysaccharide/colanic/teichoic acid biosynthesis glycosyltransferase